MQNRETKKETQSITCGPQVELNMINQTRFDSCTKVHINVLVWM